MDTTNEVDKYIVQFPIEVQLILEQVRTTIKEIVPEAEETIKWAMPTYVLKGNVVHFAGHKKHVGLYPGISGIETFKDELSEYKTSKGAIQFKYSKPIPFDLIARIVKFRVEENLKNKKSR